MNVEKVDNSVDNVEKPVDKKGKNNYTYIVKCRDGSLYTGWTNDLKKRIRAHNEGKGAKYTKSRRPVTLVTVKPLGRRRRPCGVSTRSSI